MSEQVFEWALAAAGTMLLVAITLVTLRLVKGPDAPDRVIALDLIGTLTAGTIGVYAMSVNDSIYILVSTVLALVVFVSTVAFAYHLERGGHR